jgi:hypothetical protein
VGAAHDCCIILAVPLFRGDSRCATASAHTLYAALPAFVNLSAASAAFALYAPTVGPCVPQGSGFTVSASTLPALVSWYAVNGAVALASPPALNVFRLALAKTDCFLDPTDPNSAGQVVFSPPPLRQPPFYYQCPTRSTWGLVQCDRSMLP